MAAILRVIAGALLVAVLIAAGSAARIVAAAQPTTPATADVIVVLGAAQYNGTPSPVFAARLDHAAELYRAGSAPRIVTTGANQVGDAWTEAAAGAHYLQGLSIPESDLIDVPQGGDTLQSLRAVAEVLQQHGWNDVILVTDPWHMARCRAIGRDIGWQVQTSPVESGPAVEDTVRVKYAVREFAALMFYRIVGGSSGLGSTVL